MSDVLSDIMRQVDALRVRYANETIKEFRMPASTLEKLKRHFAFDAPSGSKIADLRFIGIPVVLDPRIPDGKAVPILVEEQPFIWDNSNTEGNGLAEYLLQRYQPLPWPRPRITDEAPGMTLVELLGEIDQALEQG